MSKELEKTETAAIELITEWHEEKISQQALIEGLVTEPITVGYQPRDEEGNPRGERENGLWDELVDFASRGVLPTEVLERVTEEGEFAHLDPALSEVTDKPLHDAPVRFSIFDKPKLSTRIYRKFKGVTPREIFSRNFWRGISSVFNVIGVVIASLMAVGCVIAIFFIVYSGLLATSF